MEFSMKTTYLDLVQFEKWNLRIFRLFWGLLVLLIINEAATFAPFWLNAQDEAASSLGTVFLQKTLLPVLIYLVTLSAAQLLFMKVRSNLTSRGQARFTLVVSILLVMPLVLLHPQSTIVSSLFFIPILLSIIYIDAKILTFSVVLCAGSYLLSHYAILVPLYGADGTIHSTLDVITMLTFMIELWILSRLIVKRISEIIQTTIALNAKRENLSREVKLDAFTQLYNHATFYEKLDEAILDYNHKGLMFSILVLDLDDFKKINDTYGHDVGDKVILRLVDTINCYRGRYPAFRYGGEEFVLLVPLGAKDAAQLADSIRQKFADRRIRDLGKKSVTVSIGVCEYHPSYGGRREFFSGADQALYAAKRQGKNCVITSSGVQGEFIHYDDMAKLESSL